MGSLGLSINRFKVHIGSNVNQIPYVYRVTEVKDRVSNEDISYSGTVRMVGIGQTYSTISAAYAAASNGDIIQLIDGTYDLASETSSYLLINTAGKGVLIRGNSSDNTAVKLTCASAASYGIRLRNSGQMTFQDLTIEGTGSAYPIYMDAIYEARWIKFKNCIITKTTTANFLFYRVSTTTDTNTIHIEFENCVLNQNTNAETILYTNSGINETLLITGCTINQLSTSSSYKAIKYNSSHKGKIVIYDSVVRSSNSAIIIQIGEDGEVPTNSVLSTDLRNNTVEYTSTSIGHAVLIGRGVTNGYIINNDITVPESSDSVAFGVVIKSTNSEYGYLYFAGNKIIAPRPMYVKGGMYNLMRYNTIIANYSNYGTFGINNPDDSLLSSFNHLKFNTILGKTYSINCLAGAATEDEDETIKAWQIDNNNYQFDAGNWLIKANLDEVSFADKTTFYGNGNDQNSKLLASNELGDEKTVTDEITLN